MKKILSILGPVVSTLMSFGIMFLYVAGLVHSYKKHSTKDLIFTIFIPPFTVYRGAEMFWHSDEDIASKDKSYLNDKVKVAVYLVLSAPEKVDAKKELEFSETKDDFRDAIKKLNPNDLSYVKEGSGKFLDYMESIQLDIINAVAKLKQTKSFDFSESETSLALAKQCSMYGLDKDISDVQAQLETMQSNLSEKISNDPDALYDKRLENEALKQEMVSYLERSKQVHSALFNF